MIEKILEKLEAEMNEVVSYDEDDYYLGKYSAYGTAIEIVQEVAKEQNSEWVLAENGKQPNVSEYCSRYFWVTITRKDSNIFVTEKLRWIGYMKRWEWSNGRELSSDYDVIAWREYFAPAPYQKGE